MIQITIISHSHQIKMLFVPLCNYTNLKIPLILPMIALYAMGKRSFRHARLSVFIEWPGSPKSRELFKEAWNVRWKLNN